MGVWDGIKSWARWVYDWITVLVGLLVGVPTVLIDLLNAFGGVDISPLVGNENALKITAGVALAKALLSLIETWMNRE